MKLVDSSAWIESLRPAGDPAVRERVNALVISGEAAWCSMVRLELWNGARGEQEKRVLRDMERYLIDLAIDPPVWSLAIELARKSRIAGKTIPPIDLLIAACAWRHDVAIEHADEHFDALAALK